ncbi:MAG: serine hydrolase [Gammaproteobacteria bacterium]|nr:serine hydrolase [Gammaproteobacteria bacterium]
MEEFVDKELLAGAISVVLKDNKVVDKKTWGYADTDSQSAIRDNTIFRIYSNTKIITSVAAMCLYEDGKFDLEDPLEKHLPQFEDFKVLKTGATDPTETEDIQSIPTVKQVMSHQAGFSYGIFSESPVDVLYMEREVSNPRSTLAEMVDKLAHLPLAYQPGARFQYSVSTDVLARLVEIWSGMSFAEFLREKIFIPLRMVDTDFYVPEEKHGRLATNYRPTDPKDPMKPGLTAAPDVFLGSFLEPKSFNSGGAGLVSTISDYTNFIRMLVGEGEFKGVRILKPESVSMMHTNLLQPGIQVQLPNWFMPSTVFGIGLAIKNLPMDGEPSEAIGEFHWGGIAGTHTWISPGAGIAALIFTQRLPGFCHEFSHEFKRQVYKAMT